MIASTVSTAPASRKNFLSKLSPVKLVCFGVWGAVGVGVVGLLSANLQPYSEFFGALIPFAGGTCGKALFIAIQGLEILPELARMTRASLNQPPTFYKNINLVGLFALGLDAAFCFNFWPPFTVPVWQLMAGFSPSMVDWQNVAFIAFTLFAGMIWIYLLSVLVMPHLTKRPTNSNS